MDLAIPVVGTLGWPELVIVLLVVLLIFGGKKLPEIARGTGRALRIFKSETKGLMHEDDEAETDTAEQKDHTASQPPQITGSSTTTPTTSSTSTESAAEPHHQTGS